MLYGLIHGARTLSVIGMCKNAGKTTVLNALVSCCCTHGEVLGLTSIGRDGETRDVVTGTGKPAVFVPAGTIVATAAALLPECEISRKILCTTGVHTPLGEVVIIRAMSDGDVQIAGASMTDQAAHVRDGLFDFGADRVLIDGALSRKSLAMPLLCDAAILCTGASYSPDMRATVEDAVHAASRFTLPVYAWHDELSHRYTAVIGGGGIVTDTFDPIIPVLKRSDVSAIIIKGGFTDGIAAELAPVGRALSGVALVCADPSRLLLSRTSYDRLLRCGATFMVQKSMRLAAVTVNPFSASGNHYDKSAFEDAVKHGLSALDIRIPTINIMDVKHA